MFEFNNFIIMFKCDLGIKALFRMQNYFVLTKNK